MRRRSRDRTAHFVEIQGVTRAGVRGDIWTKTYDAKGAPCDAGAADAARTALYSPHGGVRPARNFLVADSDYVEVLTEIDIQTPIPAAVKARRAERGFLSSAAPSTTRCCAPTRAKS